ncbi:hypothetical protein [Peribacillus frigoritolerans]|uniref:hypothetical protein n=2 Tax=Peribacillus frigoritolerans TaxID=450367 RepID=UPI0011A7C28A|nr:hypothetical protein [Peribacillus frigoritolerans]
MNFELLLRNWSVTREFWAFTREFRAFTREFWAFTREFEDFTREFMRSRKFGAFTCEFLSFLLGETSNTSCLYLFFFNIPVRIKETKKRRDSFLQKESRLF